MTDTVDFDVPADHCLEMGTIIQAGDTHLELMLRGTEQQINQRFSQLEQMARSITDHVTVHKEVYNHKGLPIVTAMFDFNCTAEKLIFELKL